MTEIKSSESSCRSSTANKLSTKTPKWLSIGVEAHGRVAIGVSAHGIVAIGVSTHGIISIGCISMGVISFGLVSMGIVSTALVSMGIASFGSHTMGLVRPLERGLVEDLDTTGSEGATHDHTGH